MRGRRGGRAGAWIVALALCAGGCCTATAGAAQLPPGFSDRVALDGLVQPTSVAFAADGRILVAEKRGVLLAFDDARDTTPLIVADLRAQVHSFYERGLLSVALDPRFPAKPFVYVGYTHDAPVGGTAPLWGAAGVDEDRCLPGEPELSFDNGCEVSARVSRLTLRRTGTASHEEVLLEDWCQQFPSHSIGDLAFDRRGGLLIGAGDGASFDGPDLGQLGEPAGACDDPPGEGGALRAQDLVTDGDPLGLAGTISRIDPASGLAMRGNPSIAAGGNEGRIIASGLRNPFRFTTRPGTDELWIGDVGWSSSDEIDVTETDRRRNFGWPCFEGTRQQADYAGLGTSICNTLYAAPGSIAEPWLAYGHEESVVAGDRCPDGDGGSSISGLAFDSGPRFPAPYDGGLFFADYARDCIWWARAGAFGTPQRSTLRVFESSVENPVDLVVGPAGLYYVDLFGGTVRRIAYERPTAELRLRSRPSGIELDLGERVEAAPASITLERGAVQPVAAPAKVAVGGRSLRFERWSDGADRRREVVATAYRSVTAIYACAAGCRR